MLQRDMFEMHYLPKTQKRSCTTFINCVKLIYTGSVYNHSKKSLTNNCKS